MLQQALRELACVPDMQVSLVLHFPDGRRRLVALHEHERNADGRQAVLATLGRGYQWKLSGWAQSFAPLPSAIWAHYVGEVEHGQAEARAGI